MGVPSQAGYLGLLGIWLAGIIYLAYKDTVPVEAMMSNHFEYMQLLNTMFLILSICYGLGNLIVVLIYFHVLLNSTDTSLMSFIVTR